MLLDSRDIDYLYAVIYDCGNTQELTINCSFGLTSLSFYIALLLT